MKSVFEMLLKNNKTKKIVYFFYKIFWCFLLVLWLRTVIGIICLIGKEVV